MIYLISLLSFFLPTQLSIHINEFATSAMGFRIDYLIPTIYLTDIIIFLIFLNFLINIYLKGFNKNKINYKKVIVMLFYFTFILINIFVSNNPLPSIYKWTRITEFIFLFYILVKNKRFNFFKHTILPLSYSMIVINILGIFQFINKGSIGGIFYYLGERAYTFLSPNVAPYPYSTFSHSNSFAGFLLVFIIFILIYKSKIDKRLFFFTLVLSLVNLFLTNSLNVWLASVLLSIMYVLKKYVRKENITKIAFTYTLLNLDLNQRFITHRVELAKASILMTKENILFGVGLNNFIFKLSNMGSFYYNSWELQPVHNIFLLTLSETGIIGLISFLFFLIPVTSLSNFPLLAIIFTGMFDHYSLTLQQNMLFFVFVFVYSYKKTLKKVK